MQEGVTTTCQLELIKIVTIIKIIIITIIREQPEIDLDIRLGWISCLSADSALFTLANIYTQIVANSL